jgi:2-oxoglutarate ferredoxin oxidoreductase subunit alpha
VIPGTPGLEHRLGGLEKDFISGNVSYDPINHERMSMVRAAKVQKIAQECGELDLFGEPDCDLLMVGWGGTFGSLRQAATRMRAAGKNVSHVHLHWIAPLNPRLQPLLRKAKKIMVPELNMGQLRTVLRAEYLVDAIGYNKVQGQPFKVSEIMEAADHVIAGREPNVYTDLEGLIQGPNQA